LDSPTNTASELLSLQLTSVRPSPLKSPTSALALGPRHVEPAVAAPQDWRAPKLDPAERATEKVPVAEANPATSVRPSLSKSPTNGGAMGCASQTVPVATPVAVASETTTPPSPEQRRSVRPSPLKSPVLTSPAQPKTVNAFSALQVPPGDWFFACT